MKLLLETHDFVLMEAAIVEQLRRNTEIKLHDLVVNAALIYDAGSRNRMQEIYQSYIDIAANANMPFVMCTPTWRTNRERVIRSGVSKTINQDAVYFLQEIKNRNAHVEIKIGGLIGCKNDCYLPNEGLSMLEAEQFHQWQIEQLTQAGVDFLIAETLPSLDEARGIAKAMAKTNLPYVISFVINRKGTLMDGHLLIDAISSIDKLTNVNPLGYMINCAYPSFLNANSQPEEIFSRLIGYLANASSLDQCELDNAQELQSESISEWGAEMCKLNKDYGIKVLGGCCGTGAAHLQYIVDKMRD